MTELTTKDIYSTKCQVSLNGLLVFEIKSLCGRLFFNRKPKLKHDVKNLLNLGCGQNKLQNFINADFFELSASSILFGNKNRLDWMLDLRFPLNCDDNIWDGVFTEHTLEHLYPDQAQRLLQELYRTMKPGAWLRVTVPDLKNYVNYYSGQEVHQKFKEWQTGCEAMRTLTQDYFHLSLWDSKLLGKCLSASGFINVQEVVFMQGTDTSLLKDKKERAWETLYMEAQKPLQS
ncbi:class I SAM-dependent methyltransferase [Nodularia spumigena]|jgi:predicted SAM-dependent methyltransferase|uniref:class I SAM-dependent methyltransferase n=1 Tax=Nodularia spumigena TaxID=70799 RepID=UPI002B221562|nr:methyltransferase domain-containing protein [Nodularia spumigena]MEA5557813.1 methyltransferase domain-containing protein [Nodularia spumigena CH309]